MQTKKESVIEVLLDTVSGYVLGICVQVVAFPLFGIETSILTNLKLGLLFLIVSMTRKFIWRRFWNRKDIAKHKKKKARKLAKIAKLKAAQKEK